MFHKLRHPPGSPTSHPPACRTARRRGEVCPGERGSGVVPEGVEEELRYPENIVAANLAYFLLAPTLCYQLTYPRRCGAGRCGRGRCGRGRREAGAAEAGAVWRRQGADVVACVPPAQPLCAHPLLRPAAPAPPSSCCSKRFRARWMAKKLLMLTGGLGLMLFSIEQYIQPTIDNSMRPLREMVRGLLELSAVPGCPGQAACSVRWPCQCTASCRPLAAFLAASDLACLAPAPAQDWLRMLERILKLSIPTLYWWLAMFYTLFDLWLNIIAELLRFGDREFYKVQAVGVCGLCGCVHECLLLCARVVMLCAWRARGLLGSSACQGASWPPVPASHGCTAARQICLPACLPACPPACLPACLRLTRPACLPGAGVVECHHRGRVLAAVEPAGAQVDAATRLLPAHPPRGAQVPRRLVGRGQGTAGGRWAARQCSPGVACMPRGRGSGVEFGHPLLLQCRYASMACPLLRSCPPQASWCSL